MAYYVDTKVLARVLSCPAGAESTGLHAVASINRFTYVMSNFEHVAQLGSGHPRQSEGHAGSVGARELQGSLQQCRGVSKGSNIVNQAKVDGYKQKGGDAPSLT